MFPGTQVRISPLGRQFEPRRDRSAMSRHAWCVDGSPLGHGPQMETTSDLVLHVLTVLGTLGAIGGLLVVLSVIDPLADPDRRRKQRTRRRDLSPGTAPGGSSGRSRRSDAGTPPGHRAPASPRRATDE